MTLHFSCTPDTTADGPPESLDVTSDRFAGKTVEQK